MTDNTELIAQADDLRGMSDGAIQVLVGDLKAALAEAERKIAAATLLVYDEPFSYTNEQMLAALSTPAHPAEQAQEEEWEYRIQVTDGTLAPVRFDSLKDANTAAKQWLHGSVWRAHKQVWERVEEAGSDRG